MHHLVAGGTKARGEIREQYCHAIDLVPTDPRPPRRRARPRRSRGTRSRAFDGVSMRETLRRRRRAVRAEDAVLRDARLARRSGTRAGRRSRRIRRSPAGATSTTTNGSSTTSTSTAPRSHNLAAEQPDKLRELVNIWFAEAGANSAFPLDDRSALEIMSTPRPQLTAPRDRYVYFPGTAAVPEWQAVNVEGPLVRDRRARRHPEARSGRRAVRAGLAVRRARPLRQGQPAALREQLRRHRVEQKVVGTEDVPTGENLILSASFEKDGQEPDRATGTLSLYHGDNKVGEGEIKIQLGALRSPARACTSADRRASASPTTTRARRRYPSPAARSTGSRSTSAASPTSIWSAKPQLMLMRE